MLSRSNLVSENVFNVFDNQTNVLPMTHVPQANLMTLVINEDEEVALIRYVKSEENKYCSFILIDIMKYNTNAEEAIALDVEEKLGLKVRGVGYLNSFYHKELATLNLGYVCKVYNEELNNSKEIKQAKWMNVYDACKKLKSCNESMFLLKNYLEIL